MRKVHSDHIPIVTNQQANCQLATGGTVDHQFAKELLAGFAGAEADKYAETYGLNEAQKLEAHHKAKKNAEQLYDQHYVQGQGADQYDPNRYGPPNFKY